jgi:hypothetical protein
LAVAGIILLLAGEWWWALASLLAAVVLGVVGSAVGGRGSLSTLRARAAVTREAMAARSREQVDLFRVRRELADLEAERGRLYRDLGAAVYEGDEAGMDAARAALDAVGERVRTKEAEIDVMRQTTQERVGRAQADATPTAVLEAPPEPARVPEPWPPPDEGDIPDPGPTPAPGEPAPAPDEPASPEAPSAKTGG